MMNIKNDNEIITILKYMKSKKYFTTQDFEESEREKFEIDNDSNIYFPDFDLNVLKRFSGATIIGGGKNECLLEIQLLMKGLNLRYKAFNKFIY